MVLFGELVLPSSRILWDEENDYEQFDDLSESIEWEGDKKIPEVVRNLVIIETKKLSHIARTCLNEETKPLCFLSLPNVNLFKLKEDDYLVLCEEGKDVIAGEVTEKLKLWIEKAKNVTAVTYNNTTTFYKNDSKEMPLSFIRTLCSGKVNPKYAPKLEVPNLLTGISAGVLSYCQHSGKSAALYVCYSDSRPFDSITAEPIIQLLQKFNISTSQPFTFKPVFVNESNLYI